MGKQIKELTARLAVAGDDMLPMQGANDLNYYGTVAQLGGYIGNYTKGLIEAAVTCGSAADDENKAVTLTLGAVPSHLTVTFTNGNTYGDTTAAEPTNPKLVVTTSDGVEHTYNICDSRGHITGKGFCNAGDDIDFIIIGNKARIQNSDIRQAEANYTIKADGYIEYPFQKHELQSGDDLNELSEGYWIAKTSAIGDSLLNKPSDNIYACFLHEIRPSTNTRIQIIYSTSGSIYNRRYSAGTWASWYKHNVTAN